MKKLMTCVLFFVISLNVHGEIFWQTGALEKPYLIQEETHEKYFFDSLKNRNHSKPILLVIGRNNCGWTRGLLRLFKNYSPINSFLDQHFNLILVNTKTTFGLNLKAKLEQNTHYEIDGVPHIAILKDFTDVDNITGTNLSSVPFEAYVDGKGMIYEGEQYYHDADKIISELKNWHY